ncbi:DEAD/DEAH box helicase ['Cynodon dactylon' phytoplasma]|uniref:DEAD/DEAH box helicase n=1 Tax='Cynodon dactylon' phytoplasma TaxID=295320 RepID=UPI001265CBEA|nr:DEAD/DEAH box helicase ['Cynodon dactylon' phytoplasma]KAB8121690.1 DEAD/DEAH box helicase ['Cynodon dactylon' phytoplasma]
MCVAPTGVGKTIIFTALLEYFFRTNQVKKICVLCHRDEINVQNKKRFEEINPYITTGLFDGKHKDWDKQAIFAMFQTLGLDKNLLNLDAIDMLIVDEAHRASASLYQNIINYFKMKNDNFKLLGFTATPERGDGINLLDTFDNVADEITIDEAIKEGYLIEPEEEIIILEDKNIQEKMAKLKYKNGEYDMDQAEEIVNNLLLNNRVFDKWKEYAKDRQTIIFCTNLKHVNSVTEHFKKNNIKTESISEKTTFYQRKEILNDFKIGKIQILINCNILTEGFDEPSVSCIMILRPVRFRTTFYQIIGRGLRNNNGKKCLIICWGYKKHIFEHIYYVLEEEYKSNSRYIKRYSKERNNYSESRKPSKYIYTDEYETKKINITEIKIKKKLKDSEFEWYKIFNKENITGFITKGYYNKESWVLIVYLINKKEFIVISGKTDNDFNILTLNKDKDYLNCLIKGEKWLKNLENEKKTHYKRNINKGISEKQLNNLKNIKFPELIRELEESKKQELTSFQASLLITICFKIEKIKNILGIEKLELCLENISQNLVIF